jgi:hypothetical protein
MTESPLTGKDIQDAKNGSYECELLRRELERQKACGLDCDELELRNEHLDQFFKAVCEQYGPLVKPKGKAT